MRIVILNWRDIRSPRGGGAERITHEVARRLVERGDSVDWVSSAGPGLPADETLDGVVVHRRGSELTTRLHAPQIVRRLRPDLVIEEINTLPYFAPKWAQCPVVLYMNQLARDVWWYEAPLPTATIGWLVEPLYLRAYSSCDAITISNSSRDDLRRVGIDGRITVAPMAIDVPRVPALQAKACEGRMLAVGRLTPSKRYDDAIRALVLVREQLPAATLTLIGDGRERARLEALAQELGVGHAVLFPGRVSEGEKMRRLDECDVLIGTSVREGWGLTVTEAAARGTTAVVYDIPGFRDSVIDGRTGVVVRPSPEDLARAVVALIGDRPRFERLRLGAWRLAPALSYGATAAAFAQAIDHAVL